MKPRKRLGELLVEGGIIDALQLQAALGHQRQWGIPLGRALIEKRLCTEQQIVAALSKQSGLPIVELDLTKLERTQAMLLPARAAQTYRAVPLRTEGARGEVLVVALGGHANLEILDGVRNVSGKSRVVAFVAKDSLVDRALEILYGGYEPPKDAAAGAGVAAHVEGETEFELGAEPSGPFEIVHGHEHAPGPEAAFVAAASELDDLLGVPRSAAIPLQHVKDEVDQLLGVQPPAERELAEAQVEDVLGLVSGDSDHTPSPAKVADAVRSVVAAPPAPVKQPPPPLPAAPHPAATTATAQRPVIILGWPDPAAQLLRQTLEEAGLAAVVTAHPVQTQPTDVLVAPLPVVEALVAANNRPAASIIVAVKSPEADLHRAQQVGARGYLATPVDSGLLLRAVRRCMRR